MATWSSDSSDSSEIVPVFCGSRTAPAVSHSQILGSPWNGEGKDSGVAPVGLGPTAPFRVGGPPYSLPGRLFAGTPMGG